MKSRSLAERVASLLKLGDESQFFKPHDTSLISLFQGGGGKPPSLQARQAWAAGILLGNVSVTPVPGSRLVDISYIDPSPDLAQKIANGYAEAYIAANIDKRFDANAYAKTFLEDQTKQLKIKLEESEKALLDFAQKEKIVELTDKASIAENNLAAANAAIGQLIAERMKNEQISRQVETTTAINLPQFLSNSVIELLRAQHKALETEYQEKLENYKPDYPLMVQIRNKIKEIDRQLAAEVKTIRNALKAAYEASLAQENGMKARIEVLKSEVLDLQKKNIQYNILKRDADTYRGLYNSLLQRYKEVDIAGGVGSNNIFVVDKAQRPGAPAEPNIPKILMLSFAMGLGAGIGISLLLELLDDKIRAPDELEQLTRLPTLGVIPNTELQVHEVLNDPKSGVAEAYRSMAVALQFSTGSGLPRSISVTSAGAAEGKSTTALAIALFFAQSGLRVLIVDADLRKPSLHTKLNLINSVGLTNYLAGSALPPQVLQRTMHPNLAFMASGPKPPNPAELLSGPKLYSLISTSSEVFDVTVFDTPPMLGLADAQVGCVSRRR